MSKTHVWLLHQDSPKPGSGGLKTFLKAQLNDPLILPNHFFNWLIRWFLLRHRTRRCQVLPGPCQSINEAEHQARELERLLGSDFQCHILRRYDESGDVVFKSTPARANVIIAPLIPHRSGALRTALNRARQQLMKARLPLPSQPYKMLRHI